MRLAALLQAVLFIVFLAATIIHRTFWDMFTWIDDFLRADRGHWVGYLWKAHNDHHLVLLRLLTALDVSVFAASGMAFVAAATAATGATAWLIWRELRAGGSGSATVAGLVWLGPMLVLTVPAAVDCSVPVNVVYPLALLFMVLSQVLFGGDAGRTGLTGARRAGALGSAMLASWCNAVGLVAFPVLVWSAWRGSTSRLWLLATGVIGAGYVAFYAVGVAGGHAPASAGVLEPAHFLKMLDYALAYLGLPLSRVPGLGLPSRLLGAVLLCAGMLAVFRDAFLPRSQSRLHRFGIGLVLMALAAALLAAVGRVDLEPEVKVPVRYAVLVAPLHIGLLVLALPWLASVARTRRGGWLVRGGAVVLAVGLLAFQLIGGRSAISASRSISAELARYEAGGRDATMERTVFPDLAEADRITAALRVYQRRANQTP